jgi:nucleotide-binding universal stress UspA family protein
MPPQAEPTLLGVTPLAPRAPHARAQQAQAPHSVHAPHVAHAPHSAHAPLAAHAPHSLRAVHAAPATQTRTARVRRYRIVVGVDLSEYADIVVEHALDQAARHEAPELHFLTVRERRRPSVEEYQQALWERVHPSLETFNQFGTDWRARLHVRRGRPEVEIAELAAELRADLIVIGQFGLHNPRATDKNLPNRVLQQAVCPTLVVCVPETVDSPQCPMCAAVREDTEGESWFCPEHGGDRADAHAVSPLTSWSRGALVR